MRRGLAAGVIVALLATGTAWADETIVARAPNEFAAAVTTIDQGEKVTLQNLDIAGHDVVSSRTGDDNKPLFRSDLVAPGSSGPVVGTEYLTTGSYPFVCTVHPGMGATLEVTSAGSPVPRPGADGEELSVRIATKKLAPLVKKGKLRVRVASAEGTVALKGRVRAGKRRVAFRKARVTFDEAGTRTVALKLSKAARRALRGRKRAKVAVTATADHGGGHTATAKATRTLR